MNGYMFFGSGWLNLNQYDFQDKERNMLDYIGYMLNRCMSMFRYKNLPETIPARELELMLQTNGNVCVTEVDGKLYAFTGGFGGEPNEYYGPTIYTVANPYLKFNKNLKVGDECIVIPNDSLYMGLMPIHRKYASMLVENDLSLRLNNINTRTTSLISASDDRTASSAERYLQQLEDGDLAIVGETPFLDGVRVQPYSDHSSGQNLISLMEYQQFIKASWFNELGLDSTTNLKREYVNESEIQMTGDSLLPLVDDMLRSRLRAIVKINEKYGTEITVELNSAWEDNQQTNDNILTDSDNDGEYLDDSLTSEEHIEESVTRTEEIIEEVEGEHSNIEAEEIEDEIREEDEDEDKQKEEK